MDPVLFANTINRDSFDELKYISFSYIVQSTVNHNSRVSFEQYFSGFSLVDVSHKKSKVLPPL